MKKHFKIKLWFQLRFFYFFNQTRYVKIKLLQKVIKHFKINSDLHIQQLYVDACKMLSLKQDEKYSKKYIYGIIAKNNYGNLDINYEASFLPTPKIKYIHDDYKPKILKLTNKK